MKKTASEQILYEIFKQLQSFNLIYLFKNISC